MNALKGLGAAALGIVIFVALAFVADILIEGTATVSVWLLPFLSTLSGFTLIICILVLLPLAIFRSTRGVSALGLMLSSYIFGLSTWVAGFLITYALWGGLGIIIGLMFAGVGVVPLAIVALALHSEWRLAAELILSIALIFGSRLLATYLGETVDTPRREQVQSSF